MNFVSIFLFLCVLVVFGYIFFLIFHGIFKGKKVNEKIEKDFVEAKKHLDPEDIFYEGWVLVHPERFPSIKFSFGINILIQKNKISLFGFPNLFFGYKNLDINKEDIKDVKPLSLAKFKAMELILKNGKSYSFSPNSEKHDFISVNPADEKKLFSALEKFKP